MNRIIIQLILVLLAVFVSSCSKIEPEFDKNLVLNDGDIIMHPGVLKNKGYKDYPKKIKADYYSLAVKENRNVPESRIITIPIIKLHSLSTKPKEPVFLMYGGPGVSNIWKYPRLWLLDNHDIVMVGYRGVDGSVQLESDAFGQALLADSNVLSLEHIIRIGTVWQKEMERYKNEGIDINGYTVIEVIDDIESARNKLGYNKINLFGSSYGTRIAYLYGLRYPESIKRTFMELINPPGHFVWDPELTDSIIKKYGELWKNDPSNLERSPDILLTIKKVFETLPVKWKTIHVDPAKVRLMMFNVLYTTDGAGQIFDAFIAAENGDYSGLAFLIMMYDMLPDMGSVWGDSFFKAVSADYQSGTNYLNSMNSRENLVGAPMSKLFAVVDYSGWEVQMIPAQYRKLDTSYVNTLMINGNLDVSTPLTNARELINYLPNGNLVVLTDRGHQDLGLKQREEFRKMITDYYLTGNVNDTGFYHIPAYLGIPKQSPQKFGKLFYTLKRLGLSKLALKFM